MVLSVLLVDDSATDTKLILRALNSTGHAVECERVEDAVAMRSALDRKTWDLVISDWSMPRFSAPAALSVLTDMGLDIPFIIVSGTIGEESAVDAMRAGAHDYVLKDRLGRLAPVVERELRECAERAARRHAEQALRESETRFRRLSDSGVIGITVADIRGATVEANDAYLSLVRFSREELLAGAIRWAELTPPEFTHLDERAIALLEETGVAPAWETETFRKDGSRLPVLVGVAMLDYPKCIAFTADLSAQRYAEQAQVRLSIEAKSAQVGRVHAEEALRESEQQLRQAQKMEALGRLAGGVAHDFNNVLSVILSYVELILADRDTPTVLRGDIEEICKAAERAAVLTQQLLLISREQNVRPKVLDVNEVLNGMDKMLRRILGEDVELVVRAGEAVCRASAQPSHLEHVILNLAMNACDAMPTGGILSLETANVTIGDDHDNAFGYLPVKPGPYVMLAVTDSGCGMSKAVQTRIFEPFFTTKEKGKGTGLGLSTVFGIVQQSGGTMTVRSEPGEGSTFQVFLPHVDADLDSVRPIVAPATLRGTETILLVEDDEQVRSIAQEILQRQGYLVIAAQSGADALFLCDQHERAFDLLLTDVVMPHMSGPELARRLQATRPEMKLLCMSGYTEDRVDRHRTLDSNVAFIEKPFTPGSLATRVREVLDQRS